MLLVSQFVQFFVYFYKPFKRIKLKGNFSYLLFYLNNLINNFKVLTFNFILVVLNKAQQL